MKIPLPDLDTHTHNREFAGFHVYTQPDVDGKVRKATMWFRKSRIMGFAILNDEMSPSICVMEPCSDGLERYVNYKCTPDETIQSVTLSIGN